MRNYRNLQNFGVFLQGRSYSTVATPTSTANCVSRSAEWKEAKSYEEMPGPKAYPIVGNFWRFIPGIGEFSNPEFSSMQKDMYEKYGKISKLDKVFVRNDWVFLFDPVDVEKVFRNEGKWPERFGNLSLTYYRNVYRKEIYKSGGGLLTVHGEAWAKFRSKVNQTMLQPRAVVQYVGPIQEVAQEFVDKMKTLRDDKGEMPGDFINELFKWSFEYFLNVLFVGAIALIALDSRLGCLSPHLSANSDAQRSIDAVQVMFDTMLKLDFGASLWRIVSTPTWKKFVQSQDHFYEISMKRINEAIERIKSRASQDIRDVSVLEKLLLNNDDPMVACVMALDMMLAGIDTTSYTVAAVMYLMSKNPQKQQKLYEELKQFLPDKSQAITSKDIENMKYLRASIKETNRMKPVAIGNLRRIQTDDMVLGNYRIPKGTDVLIGSLLMNNLEENFPQADCFRPERWLKGPDGKSEAQNTHPFVYMPFGFGARMCIGKRFAELEIETLVAKIFRNFHVEYHYGEATWKSKPLYTITDPLRFKIVERPE